MDQTLHRPPGDIAISIETGHTRLALSGTLGVQDVPRLERVLHGLPADAPLVVDATGLDRLDTSVAWALVTARSDPTAVSFDGANPRVATVVETVRTGLPKPDPAPAPSRGLAVLLARLGEGVTDNAKSFAEFAGILGLFGARLAESLVRPSRFHFTALIHHAQAVGLQAVPIVSLLAFLIGVVLAFQGAAQLQQFGAEIFVVELIAIAVLRELGVLLTAIIVAGRTASAFTAAIGSMKMREEIDAMQTLGIDPAHALIVPRVLALILMLPILALIANAAGLFGGALMAWIELGISPSMFATRLVTEIDVSNVVVGLSKAPVFALLIGIIGCQAGLRVESTAESLGRMTSSSVVAAIFAVILADALFSIFFQQVGL